MNRALFRFNSYRGMTARNGSGCMSTVAYTASAMLHYTSACARALACRKLMMSSMCVPLEISLITSENRNC